MAAILKNGRHFETGKNLVGPISEFTLNKSFYDSAKFHACIIKPTICSHSALTIPTDLD